MSVVRTIEGDLEAFFHPIKNAVLKAVADAEAVAKAEEANIAVDVRKAVADAKAQIVAETPAIEAATQALLDKLVQAAEAALVAHGL